MAYTNTPIYVVASFQKTAIHTGQHEMAQDRLVQAFLRWEKKGKHGLWGDTRADRSRVSIHNGPLLPTISLIPPHLLPVSEDIMWGPQCMTSSISLMFTPRPKATVATTTRREGGDGTYCTPHSTNTPVALRIMRCFDSSSIFLWNISTSRVSTDGGMICFVVKGQVQPLINLLRRLEHRCKIIYVAFN